MPRASSTDWRASEFGSLETDQARQGWAACEGCTLQREGSEGSRGMKEKMLGKDVAAPGVWLLPDPRGSPGAGCAPLT